MEVGKNAECCETEKTELGVEDWTAVLGGPDEGLKTELQKTKQGRRKQWCLRAEGVTSNCRADQINLSRLRNIMSTSTTKNDFTDRKSTRLNSSHWE